MSTSIEGVRKLRLLRGFEAVLAGHGDRAPTRLAVRVRFPHPDFSNTLTSIKRRYSNGRDHLTRVKLLTMQLASAVEGIMSMVARSIFAVLPMIGISVLLVGLVLLSAPSVGGAEMITELEVLNLLDETMTCER